MISSQKPPLCRSFLFDNTYVELPDRFFERINPVPVKSPALLKLNVELAAELKLNPQILQSPSCVEALAGNLVPKGAEPIAMAYAGHQFGHFVPQLGDGRALLLGEVIDNSGLRKDIQLKGSGRTSFSRRGDGRAPLGAVVREYLLSESLHALGVPTTRSLAILKTGESIRREQILPGGILVRVAASHIRIGTFEYFLARQDKEALAVLLEYTISRHYPELNDAPCKALALLKAVIARQASLIARWAQIGFVHGVMNTDNMTVSGETIDYGPCAFLDEYNPQASFSSIDAHGRYAFLNQPAVAKWNLSRFAECLLPLFTSSSPEQAFELAQAEVSKFLLLCNENYKNGMLKKIGILHPADGDKELLNDLLTLLYQHSADYHLSFLQLQSELDSHISLPRISQKHSEIPAFAQWISRWKNRLESEDSSFKEVASQMAAINPIYVPRNHLVERAINAATKADDFTVFEELEKALTSPFTHNPRLDHLTMPPLEHERVQETFCGT